MRLAWDGDRDVHVDEETGQEVVSDDGGETWRPRKEGDPSHRERYEAAGAQPAPFEDITIDLTTNGDQA